MHRVEGVILLSLVQKLVGSCWVWHTPWLGCGWESKHGPSEYLGHSLVVGVVGVTLPQGKALLSVVHALYFSGPIVLLKPCMELQHRRGRRTPKSPLEAEKGDSTVRELLPTSPLDYWLL